MRRYRGINFFHPIPLAAITVDRVTRPESRLLFKKQTEKNLVVNEMCEISSNKKKEKKNQRSKHWGLFMFSLVTIKHCN